APALLRRVLPETRRGDRALQPASARRHAGGSRATAATRVLARHGRDGGRDLRPAQDGRLCRRRAAPRERTPPMTTMTLPIRPLGTTVGAEIVGIERDQLTRNEIVAAVAEALETHGTLVFRDLDLDPETQVAFCRKLGEVDDSTDGHHPTAGIYRVTLDTS